MRILISERRSAVKARSQTMNQIHALLITAPDPVRASYRALHGERLVATLASSRPRVTATREPDTVVRISLKRLARRHQSLATEIADIDAELDDITHDLNPRLRTMHGVGPVTAATLLAAAGDNPERITTRAAFAALTGTAPMRASSGQRSRHRLSRGGNRHANAAIHRIALLRLRHREPRTLAYFERRRAEGLSDRDILRCLKRHLANEVYAALTNPEPPEHAGPDLRNQRQEHGLTIRDLADHLDVTYQRLRRLEIGLRNDPELEHRATIALDQLAREGAP